MKTIPIHVLLLLSLPGLQAAGQTHTNSLPPLKGLACSTCHTCDVPTKENPCIRECPRSGMVTVHHSAEQAPEMLVLSEPSNPSGKFEPVRFSHRWHAEMSSMSGGCALCHHYNPPGRVLACKDCHPAERNRTSVGRPDLRGAYHRQCIGCHRQWEHTTSCTGCHAYRGTSRPAKDSSGVATYAKRRHPVVKTPARLVYETKSPEGPKVTFHHDDHTGLFRLECGTCHSGESCIRCHDRRKTAGVKVPPRGGTHASCAPCHDTKRDCGKCHATAVRGNFDHLKSTGWSLGRFHAALECSRCHVKQGAFSGLRGACASCHGEWKTPDFNHAVTGLSLDQAHRELECSMCHPDGTFAQAPACDGCHEGFVYPGKSPGRRVTRRSR